MKGFTLVKNTKLIELPHWDNDTGSLVAIEAGYTVPFGFERMYYIFDTSEGAHRGFHSHRELQQLLICTHGSVDILLDDGSTRETVRLESPLTGLIVGPMVWREMLNFENQAVLTVLASRHYDEADYIRDYDAFKAEALAFFSKVDKEEGADE